MAINPQTAQQMSFHTHVCRPVQKTSSLITNQTEDKSCVNDLTLLCYLRILLNNGSNSGYEVIDIDGLVKEHIPSEI